MSTDKDFLIWAGMQISAELKGQKRESFLRVLRDNMDAACQNFSLDIEQLTMRYAISEAKPVSVGAVGDEDIVTSVTRQIFTYFRDELANAEVAALTP